VDPMRSGLLLVSALSAPMLLVAACGSNVDTQPNASTTKTATASTTSSTTTAAAGGMGAGGAAQGGGAGTGGREPVDAGPDVDEGAPSDVYPAAHAKAPKVVSGGGPVLSTPDVYPVFFAGDDPTVAPKIEDFTSKLGATEYWAAVGKEYQVGPATGHPVIQLQEAAPAQLDDSAIQTWLADKLNSDDPAFPKADDQTLFALYYPSNVTITLQSPQGPSTSCVEFGGYHSSIVLDDAHKQLSVAYAVLPRCGDFGGLTGLDALTATASHEILEASTDPYPMTMPAYGQVDDQDIYWMFALGGGEVADMCAQNRGAFGKVPGFDYVVQRSWSNKAAAHSHDPCVPAPAGEAYFNAAPVLPDTITLGGFGGQLEVKGVNIKVGESKTVEVDLFSDAKAPPWKVMATDYAKLVGGKANLDFSWDRDEGQNGEKLHLTIKALSKNQYGASIFFLTSYSGQKQNLWVGFVGN
jgi:hypothetical protein